ncbi:MAG: carbonate dehydratase [Sphingomonas bacterium]|jgi:carbonic anhydrase|nr:carbonate dehydratase [Sphingomonas bacterium]MDB5718493.1 carbonate dehydratase [Sphingomonas bacterium]
MTDFNDMIGGYRRFRASGWQRERARWERLAEGQSPQVMVIACSDSRIDPSLVFDAGPGEMFVVRNVANLVPPFELGGLRHGVSAALEFAVTQLHVREIVVMGHRNCGGVSASLSRRFQDKPPGEGGFIARWMDMLDGARDRVVAEHGQGPEAVHALELECVKVSLANLRTFPCVMQHEGAGNLKLIGAYFTIADGILHVLDEEDGAFHPA